MNWGIRPLNEIKEHLRECPACKQELEEAFEVYRHYPTEPWLGADFPAGISDLNVFLEIRHRFESKKQATAEKVMAVIDKAWPKEEMMVAVMNLLRRIHSALFGIRVMFPYWKEKQIGLLEKSYREIDHLLGREACLTLLGLTPFLEQEKRSAEEGLDLVITQWRQLLLA